VAECIQSGPALFRLDNEYTYSAHTFSGRLEEKEIHTREVETAGDASNECWDVASKLVSENHDGLQLLPENEDEPATTVYDNRKAGKPAICQAEERALPVQDQLAEYTKIEDLPQTPKKDVLDWKSFQEYFYKHTSCLEIGSWMHDGEHPRYSGEEVAPLTSLIETGTYPKHLNNENLGATQCAGNSASSSGFSGSSRPRKETASSVVQAPVEKKISKGKKRICDNDDSDDDENNTNLDGTNNRKKTKAKLALVCPLHWRLSQFSIIDDETRVKYRVCTTTKFDDVARVK
jgi:hypothetical protein